MTIDCERDPSSTSGPTRIFFLRGRARISYVVDTSDSPEIGPGGSSPTQCNAIPIRVRTLNPVTGNLCNPAETPTRPTPHQPALSHDSRTTHLAISSVPNLTLHSSLACHISRARARSNFRARRNRRRVASSNLGSTMHGGWLAGWGR